MRILMGGVPFGTDNVGDEAILECAVNQFRETYPNIEITISTGDQENTALKLGVKTIPLYGFDPSLSIKEFKKCLHEIDVFVWSGATGLSDYPKNALNLLEAAQSLGKWTILWAVGMDSKFNPAKYSVLPGKKKTLLQLGTIATLGLIDFVSFFEQQYIRLIRKRLFKTLSKVNLLVLRDPESKEQVQIGGELPKAIVASDVALELPNISLEDVSVPNSVKKILQANGQKIGICISSQRRVINEKVLIDYLDEVTTNKNCQVIFIPMNPITDKELMEKLQNKLKLPEKTAVLEGHYMPSEIQAIASKLDLVVSSRLHLLILASNVHVPIIGITRGTKIDNHLKNYGLTPVGSVYNCTLQPLINETFRLLEKKEDFSNLSQNVRSQLLERLKEGKKHLKELLSKAQKQG